MGNAVIIFILLICVTTAVTYIVKKVKSGEKCIGCSCSKSSDCKCNKE